MADKPKGYLQIRKEAFEAGKAKAKATLEVLTAERKAAIEELRKSRALVRESQKVALESTQLNASLMQSFTEQNSREGVGSTIFLSSLLATAVGVGAYQGVLYFSKPEQVADPPNFIARNRGFFEAAPGFLLGGSALAWAVARAGNSNTKYGAPDEFLRMTAASLLTVGMVRGGDALLNRLPFGIR